MRKEKVKVYCFKTKCVDCDKEITVYYTLPDFGDAPIMKRCRHCGEYYWYTREDEIYQRTIDEQLDDLKCQECGADLNVSLVPTHKDILCCGYKFSLNDDFASHSIPPNDEMVSLDVYMIYS